MGGEPKHQDVVGRRSDRQSDSIISGMRPSQAGAGGRLSERVTPTLIRREQLTEDLVDFVLFDRLMLQLMLE